MFFFKSQKKFVNKYFLIKGTTKKIMLNKLLQNITLPCHPDNIVPIKNLMWTFSAIYFEKIHMQTFISKTSTCINDINLIYHYF